MDMEKEDPNELQICEFNRQDFELITDQGGSKDDIYFAMIVLVEHQIVNY